MVSCLMSIDEFFLDCMVFGNAVVSFSENIFGEMDSL